MILDFEKEKTRVANHTQRTEKLHTDKFPVITEEVGKRELTETLEEIGAQVTEPFLAASIGVTVKVLADLGIVDQKDESGMRRVIRRMELAMNDDEELFNGLAMYIGVNL